MKELISVIIPIYNSENHLEKCLASVLGQTYSNLQIILVDDGSSDRSGTICEKYGQCDDRIHIISQANRGVAAARNAGLKIARGRWVTFVDSDDFIDVDLLNDLLNLAHNTGADLVQCGTMIETDTKSYRRKLYNLKEGIQNNGWKYLASECWGKLYLRRLIAEEKFHEEYSLGEDIDFNIRIIVRAKHFVIMDAPKYHYVQTQKSLYRSRESEEEILACRKVICRLADEFQADPAISEYLRLEKLRSALDICSKIVCLGFNDMNYIIPELRVEIRAELANIFRDMDITAKDKLKFVLVSYGWPIYRLFLPRLKKYVGQGR